MKPEYCKILFEEMPVVRLELTRDNSGNFKSPASSVPPYRLAELATLRFLLYAIPLSLRLII